MTFERRQSTDTDFIFLSAIMSAASGHDGGAGGENVPRAVLIVLKFKLRISTKFTHDLHMPRIMAIAIARDS